MIKKLKSRGNIQSLPAFSKLCHRSLRNRWMAHSIGVRTRYIEPAHSVGNGTQTVWCRCSFLRPQARKESFERTRFLFSEGRTKRARTRRRGSSALVVAAHASTASRRMRRQRRGACVGDGQERAVGIDRRLAARAQSFTSRQTGCVATAT